MKKFIFVFFIFILSCYILHTTYFIPVAYSFTVNQPAGYGVSADGDEGVLLQTVLTNAITIVFLLAGIFVVFFLLWGGIDWIMSGGDKEKVASARKKITSALIGLVLVSLTFVIANLLGTIMGFNPLQTLRIPQLGQTIEQPESEEDAPVRNKRFQGQGCDNNSQCISGKCDFRTVAGTGSRDRVCLPND